MAGAKKYESKCGKLLVAAIDFGTTFSGYAFSFKSDYESDPANVSTPCIGTAGPNILLSLKTQTNLLLNPDKTFRAFGFDAEYTYIDLAVEDMHKDYYFFRRFNVNLFNKCSSTGLKRDMELEDATGKKVKALTVFGMSIKYLKEHVLGTVKSRDTDIREGDIRWVLTVPSNWTDGSKQFMREAARVAGITDSNLVIALEPEAASLYFMQDDKMGGSGNQQDSRFKSGTKYMVVDVGGFHVDATVYEVLDEFTLKELKHDSDWSGGGNLVNEAFTQFIIKIFGRDVFEKFAEDHKDDYVSLLREFETKKRKIRLDGNPKETLRVPVMLPQKYKDMKDRDFKVAVKDLTEFQGKLVSQGDKLRMDAGIIKDFFSKPCNKTVEHVTKLLEDSTCKDVKTLLLVGGFAESPLLQEAFKMRFPDLRIFFPADPGMAVLKGAVLFGHNPLTIVSRLSNRSYGIRVFRNFREGVHPPNKKVHIGGRVKCKDIFFTHIKKGQELKVDEQQVSQRYTPLEAEQTTLVFDIFTSSEADVQYVTDVSCRYIGQVEVDVSDTFNTGGVLVNMAYGGTELIVEAVEESTGRSKKAAFDFLS